MLIQRNFAFRATQSHPAQLSTGSVNKSLESTFFKKVVKPEVKVVGQFSNEEVSYKKGEMKPIKLLKQRMTKPLSISLVTPVIKKVYW